MKRLILGVAGLGLVIGIGFCVNSRKNASIAPAEKNTESGTAPAVEPQPAGTEPVKVKTSVATVKQFRRPAADSTGTQAPALPASPVVGPSRFAFDQAIETLVSPQASYGQRQAAWKQLKETGKIDEAITTLEQRVAANPQSAECMAELGMGYWKKCGAIDDAREQAILAMKADQSFEAALNLDPSNWEARFTKAMGMTYWPPELKKGPEAIEQFRTLIQQQEAQAPQPQFAKAYLWLGRQYQKSGYPDYATQIWQRGAGLFPDDSDLRKELSPER